MTAQAEVSLRHWAKIGPLGEDREQISELIFEYHRARSGVRGSA